MYCIHNYCMCIHRNVMGEGVCGGRVLLGWQCVFEHNKNTKTRGRRTEDRERRMKRCFYISNGGGPRYDDGTTVRGAVHIIYIIYV